MIYVSEQHRIIGVPVNLDLTKVFPDARILNSNGTDFMLIPHRHGEHRVLKNMGYKIPAPVLSQYNWVGGKPFAVQKKTVALMTTEDRCYVLNAMGTGKTKSALWAFDYLKSIKVATRALVVAPLSTLNFTWNKEIFMTVPHLKARVLHGSKEKRLKVMQEVPLADIFILNTDGVKVLADELDFLLTDGYVDTVIIDELALFRNAATERHKIMRKLAEKAKRVWGMTGSPTPNEPTDVWGQARIVTPSTVPKYFKAFRDDLMLHINTFKYVPKKDANKKAAAALQPAVRFVLDDVVELPDLIERQIDVDLGVKQTKIYDVMKLKAHAMVQSGEITAMNAAGVLNKLLQISLGYVYTNDGKIATLDNHKRIEALIDAVYSTSNKVLVLVNYTHAIEAIAGEFKKEKMDFALVYGKTSRVERDRIFSLFQQTDKYHTLLCHPGTISHGLTLTAADTCIWFGPITSLETYEQTNARIRRVGQKHKQQILMMQGTLTEKTMYTRLRAKQKTQQDILSLFL